MTEISRDAAEYWDRNREKARDPTFWMAHPLCREAINRRVCGGPNEWPIDWFRRVHVARPFPRAVSFGCGLGNLERALIAGGIVSEIDAFDISRASLEDARAEADRLNIRGIRYRVGDFNDPRLERGRYDIAFFHQSLHHVSALERLFLPPFDRAQARRPHLRRRVRRPVPQRVAARNAACRAVRPGLRSPRPRVGSTVLPPIEQGDPSEAVRSGEISPFLRAYFEPIAWRPYGGQIVDLVLLLTSHAWSRSPDGTAHVARMLRLEDYELERRSRSNHYLVAVGRLKPWRGRTTPLLAQIRGALARRVVRMVGRAGRRSDGPRAA